MGIINLTRMFTVISICISFAVIGGLHLILSEIHEHRDLQIRQSSLIELANRMRSASDLLTFTSRQYAVLAKPEYRDQFYNELKEVQSREEVLEVLKSFDIEIDQGNLLFIAKQNSDKLVEIETEAIKLVDNGQQEEAKKLLFGKKFAEIKAHVIDPIVEFKRQVSYHNNLKALASTATAEKWLTIEYAILIVFIIGLLGFVHYLFIRRIVRPVIKISDTMNAIAQGDTNAAIPYCDNKNEIGKLAQSAVAFRELLVQKLNLAISMEKHQAELEEQIADRTNQLCQNNQILLEKTKQAETANYTKSRFLANMSHELRTPLAGIVGMSELLKVTKLDKKQSLFVSTICKAGDMLTEIISDILDLSEIETGDFKLNPETMNLYENVRRLFEVVNIEAISHNVELVLDYGIDTQQQIVLDPIRINQILLNLVSNAIKFTKDGHVLLHIKSVANPLQKADELIYFGIEDSGIGIAEDDQKIIFDYFNQADKSSSRRYEGSGTGLSVASKLVELMGGKLSVESELGKGTKFWFMIPANQIGSAKQRERHLTDSTSQTSAAAEKDLITNASSQPLLYKRALISDGLAESRTSIIRMLKSHGMLCKSADNIIDAVSTMAIAKKEKKPFDVILIDKDLFADMTPHTSQRIENAAKETPIIMMRKSLDAVEEETMVDINHFDHILSKPVYEDALVFSVKKALKMAPEEETQTSGNKSSEKFDAERKDLASFITYKREESSNTPSKIDGNKEHEVNILVAEDSFANQIFITQLLKEFGIQPHLVKNGKEAIESYKRSIPDLILMDCMMPEIDGYEATGAIRDLETQKGLSTTPIVALTANAMVEEQEKCLKAGMTDYMCKPANRQMIKNCLEKYLVIVETKGNA